MDNLTSFWSKGTVWVLVLIVVALALVAYVFHRIRPRKPPPVIRSPDPPWTGTPADNLDSSHIGGPIFPPGEETDRSGKPPERGPAGARK